MPCLSIVIQNNKREVYSVEVGTLCGDRGTNIP